MSKISDTKCALQIHVSMCPDELLQSMWLSSLYFLDFFLNQKSGNLSYSKGAST